MTYATDAAKGYLGGQFDLSLAEIEVYQLTLKKNGALPEPVYDSNQDATPDTNPTTPDTQPETNPT